MLCAFVAVETRRISLRGHFSGPDSNAMRIQQYPKIEPIRGQAFYLHQLHAQPGQVLIAQSQSTHVTDELKTHTTALPLLLAVLSILYWLLLQYAPPASKLHSLLVYKYTYMMQLRVPLLWA